MEGRHVHVQHMYRQVSRETWDLGLRVRYGFSTLVGYRPQAQPFKSLGGPHSCTVPTYKYVDYQSPVTPSR